ncbi:MAG: hypothetical protein V3574_00520 [Candidatus Moraniibacteriota bacterium]
MNIYLDIDGVLLKKDGSLAEYFDEFLEFFVDKHNVFWLTTHCQGRDNNAIWHINQYNEVSKRSLELLQKIKPTDWQTLKTEGIDFSQDFIWFDDYLLEAEKEILKKYGADQKVILINLNENPDILKDVLSRLRSDGF